MSLVLYLNANKSGFLISSLLKSFKTRTLFVTCVSFSVCRTSVRLLSQEPSKQTNRPFKVEFLAINRLSAFHIYDFDTVFYFSFGLSFEMYFFWVALEQCIDLVRWLKFVL